MSFRSEFQLLGLLRTGIVTGAAVLLWCAPASASDLPENLLGSIRYEVHGTISASCGFTEAGGNADILGIADPADDTVRAAKVDLPFALACNTPVQMSMTSTNGGLAFHGATTSDRDFTNLVGYGATVVLPGLGASLHCASTAMAIANGCKGQTDHIVPSGAGHIEVAVIPNDSLLLAGAYQDQLTLTVTPMVGGGDSYED